MTQVIHGLTREQLVAQVFSQAQTESDFEKWIMRISHGCADLHKN